MRSTTRDAALAHRRVLLVEDEYFMADDMAHGLRALGAEIVGPVPTRDKALALLAAEPVHAAILDINLRGQMVFPVADVLAERGVPFVFATGYGEAAVPPGYRHVPRWEKPFDPHDLARALPDLIRISD